MDRFIQGHSRAKRLASLASTIGAVNCKQPDPSTVF